MVSRTRRVRPLLGGAAFAALVLFSACSSDTAADVSSTAATTATTVAATGSTATPDTTAAVDAAALLQQGLSGLQAGYHFVSVASVNGTKALTAEGDRVGPASRFDVSTNGALVHYVVTADATYAQPDGGDWDQLSETAPVTDPVASLAAPAKITVVSTDGGAVRLKVTVSAITLGVGTSGEADVDVVITAGAITEIGYTTTVDGSVGSVATTIGPVQDSTPITAPA